MIELPGFRQIQAVQSALTALEQRHMQVTGSIPVLEGSEDPQPLSAWS